jgi:hypothetical protein
MVVQGAQTNGMTAGMNSGAFSGAAGLPESFDQYRPPVQVRACAHARPALPHVRHWRLRRPAAHTAAALPSQFSIDDTSKIPPPAFDKASELPDYPSQRMSVTKLRVRICDKMAACVVLQHSIFLICSSSRAPASVCGSDDGRAVSRGRR